MPFTVVVVVVVVPDVVVVVVEGAYGCIRISSMTMFANSKTSSLRPHLMFQG